MNNSLIILRRAVLGLLSAGGAMMLAACYGPQRTPVGPLSGTVRDASGPLADARVCVKVKDQPAEPGPCVQSDEQGTFTVPRFQSKFGSLEVCVTPKAPAPDAKPAQTCVPLDRTKTDPLVLDLSKNP
jgi:hypothetical protein